MPASRRRVVVPAVIAGAVLVYGGVVALYAVNEASRLAAVCDAAPGELRLDVAPVSVDAVNDRIGLAIEIGEPGPLEIGDVGFGAPVTILVNGAVGERAFTTPAGAIASTATASLVTDGQVEGWPFDVHTAVAQFAVLQTSDTTPEAYRPEVCASGQVSGWTLAATEGAPDDDLVVDGESVPTVVITATRSTATVAFGLVILAAMVALPVLGLTVAIAAYRGRRKVEATLMSWMAAMLFATVPLRTFLPGSPPVGSWVDYLVVLWVVAGLIGALVVYVAAWLRWTPAASGPPPTRS